MGTSTAEVGGNKASSLHIGGETPVLAVWGGIGFSRRPLKDLRDLYHLYEDELSEFVQHCSGVLRSLTLQDPIVDGHIENKSKSRAAECLQIQQDLAGWLADPSVRRPPVLPQVVTAVVTTILQMSRYVVMAKRLGVTPGELASRFTAFAGHSIGMIVAVSMAAADSWSSLYHLAEVALTDMYRADHLLSSVWDQSVPVPPSAAAECVRRGEGVPTPMLSITGTGRSRVMSEIAQVNVDMPPERKLHLAVINDFDAFVVAGGPEGLVQLCARLRTLTPPHGQTACSSASFSVSSPSPLGQPRQADPGMGSLQFLPCSVPFHSPHMQRATCLLAERSAEHSALTRDQIRVPVWGLDALLTEAPNLAGDLGAGISQLILSREVNWPAILEPMTGRWQVLDFGPGGLSGIGMVVDRMKAGSRSQTYVVCPAGIWGFRGSQPGAKGADAASSSPSPPQLLAMLPMASGTGSPRSYASVEFQPPCAPAPETPRPAAASRFTESLGLPRVLVAGMTPTTCDVDLVAAAMNAGFYAEFATGGYHDAPSLVAALRRLATMIPEGRMITVNVVYANPQSLVWVVPQLAALVREGCPIGGLVIGAGVPGPPVVAGYVEALQPCYIGFKPATAEAIQRVLDIAREHPTLPVLLQWTGGRAGGHHSLEDFHQPILETYRAIREIGNIILVAGSGFGDAEGTWPYISGRWSQGFGRPAMPFDAVLIGTCIMTTLEAKTSIDAKRAMIKCHGVPDDDWTATMSRPGGAGGVVSVVSHLGEAMHVVATRGMLLWAELDRTLFNKPKGAMAEAVRVRRADLIARLNADYQKVWFPWDYAASRAADDLGDMTYRDVLRRMLALMTKPAIRGEWAHPSYRGIFGDFLVRTLERFGGSVSRATALAADLAALGCPLEQLGAVTARVPQCGHHFLGVEDAAYFVDICSRPGQKPVPFVPVLDADFLVWFKKDPLWHSENLESTHHGDVGRVCILAGPVAIRHCREADVPVGVFLRGIDQSIQDREARAGVAPPAFYPTDTSRYQEEELIQAVGGPSRLVLGPDTVEVARDTPPEAPSLDNDTWLLLLGSRLGRWGLYALGTRRLVSGGRAYENPIRRLFSVRPGALVRFFGKDADHGHYTGAEMCSDIDTVRLWVDGDTITAAIASRCTVDKAQEECLLRFAYSGLRPYAPLCEMMHDRLDRISHFYWLTLLGRARKRPEERNPIALRHTPLTVTREHVLAWQRATDGQGLEAGSPNHLGSAGEVPIEFATVLVNEATWRHLLSWDMDASRLLHQHTEVTLREGQEALSIGDTVTVESRVTSASNGESGVMACFSMTLARDGREFVDLVLHFVFLGQQLADSLCFEDEKKKNKKKKKEEEEEEGREFIDTQADPLASFLEQAATTDVGERLPLPSERTLETVSVTTPDNSVEYAVVSGDFNPIHTLPAFARLAGFSGPILHGNQTAALVLQAIRCAVPGANAATLRRYHCSFLSVVWPNDTLTVTIKRVATNRGSRPVLGFAARRTGETEELVLEGEAVLEAPPTTFLFTGQGSQFQGMGLDLAAQSLASRKVWAEADAYFEQDWGFSITDIIKQNPVKLTVHFSGVRGQHVRQNYMDAQAMARSCALDCEVNLFSGLHARSRSYTFYCKDGLLGTTQFAQPALVVTETAAFAHLRQLGRVPPQSRFAGHSLGEFAALSVMTAALPLRAALKTVFTRGALMQAAVPRDTAGRSGFGMVAVDPSRVGNAFQEKHILEMVQAITVRTGLLLEMVNLNVKGQQYVCAGDKRCLHLLQRVTDELHAHQTLSPRPIADLVAKHAPSIAVVSPNDLVLVRGEATMPLKGIDVPFHSTQLACMGGAFRHTLVNSISRASVRPEDLIGRWIPNVTGKPFATDRKYVQLVAELTGSPRIVALLAGME